MPAMQTEAVFLPYFSAGQALSMKLVNATVDGKAESVVSDELAALVDLSPIARPWQEAYLEFEVRLDEAAPRITELVPRTERSQPKLSLIGSVHASRTYRRWPAPGTWDAGRETGQLLVAIRRSDVSGSIELRSMLARAEDQADDPTLATEKAARVAWSREWRINVDPPGHRAGQGLQTAWEEFRTSGSRWRRQHSELLFHLDTTSGDPILFLNSGIDPDLQAVLKEEAPRGKKAAARDVVFAGIAVSVWSSLLVEAEQALPAEGLPDPGWRRNVLERIAGALSPDVPADDALSRLTRELRDPNGGSAIRERVATVILEMSNMRGHAETLVRELV